MGDELWEAAPKIKPFRISSRPQDRRPWIKGTQSVNIYGENKLKHKFERYYVLSGERHPSLKNAYSPMRSDRGETHLSSSYYDTQFEKERRLEKFKEKNVPDAVCEIENIMEHRRKPRDKLTQKDRVDIAAFAL